MECCIPFRIWGRKYPTSKLAYATYLKVSQELTLSYMKPRNHCHQKKSKREPKQKISVPYSIRFEVLIIDLIRPAGRLLSCANRSIEKRGGLEVVKIEFHAQSGVGAHRFSDLLATLPQVVQMYSGLLTRGLIFSMSSWSPTIILHRCFSCPACFKASSPQNDGLSSSHKNLSIDC